MNPLSENAQPSAQMLDARVVDASGNQASILSLQAADGAGTDQQQALVGLDEGMRVLVPVSLLTLQPDGSYRLPFTFQMPDAQQPAQMRLPVMEEALQVGKRAVDTGRGVRIHKSVAQREELVDQPLMRDELVVEHVPVGRMVADGESPQTHYEGDTLVVPVLEEVLVVHKQLLLKEELRITRRQHETHAPQKVVLRSEQVKVERFK